MNLYSAVVVVAATLLLLFAGPGCRTYESRPRPRERQDFPAITDASERLQSILRPETVRDDEQTDAPPATEDIAEIQPLLPADEPSDPPEKDDEPEKEDELDKEDESDVIVEVDGEVLTRGELDWRLLQVKAARDDLQEAPPEMMEQAAERIKNQIVEGFVVQQLLLNEARRKGIEADDGKVEEAVAEIKAGLPEGKTLQTALLEEGISEEGLRENIGAQLRMQDLIALRMEDFEAVLPTDEEIKDFYEAMLDRQEAGAEPLEEVRDEIADRLMQQRRQAVVEKYVDSLKKAADIRYGQNP